MVASTAFSARSRWSVSSEIRWSVSPGTGGQFAAKSGGQFQRILQPDIRIPNAFTPNGDGINDTWDIVGLEYDQTALVKVFTRYGQQVYQSKGYGTPWNGEYQGKKLPMGAYYYIINTKNNTQTLSGEVTIIY